MAAFLRASKLVECCPSHCCRACPPLDLVQRLAHSFAVCFKCFDFAFCMARDRYQSAKQQSPPKSAPAIDGGVGGVGVGGGGGGGGGGDAWDESESDLLALESREAKMLDVLEREMNREREIEANEQRTLF